MCACIIDNELPSKLRVHNSAPAAVFLSDPFTAGWQDIASSHICTCASVTLAISHLIQIAISALPLL